MLAFDPERDGWQLQQAVLLTADPGTLAKLSRAMLDLQARYQHPRTPEWWNDKWAPEPVPSENLSNELLVRRVESLSRGAEAGFLHALGDGELICWARPGSPIAPYTRLPRSVWEVAAIESFVFNIVGIGEGQRGYAARIQPFPPSRPVARSDLRKFLTERHERRRSQGQDPTERDDFEAAQRAFGASRAAVREARQALLPPDQRRPGRRPN